MHIPTFYTNKAYKNFELAEKHFTRDFWHTNEIMKARCLYKLNKMDAAKKCAQKARDHPWPTAYYPPHVIKKLDASIQKLLE